MAKKQEFQVTVEGADLGDADVERVARAIQKAALSELAGVDRMGDFAARIMRGSTQGIRMMAVSPEQLREAGVQLEDS